jgi:hypothetical protein
MRGRPVAKMMAWGGEEGLKNREAGNKYYCTIRRAGGAGNRKC